VPAAAWRRGVRVTVTAIGVFYGCRYGLGDPTMALYAVFAVLAFSLLSQTSGPPAVRTRTLLACLGFGLVDVTIATYAAVNTWVAVLAMFVFGFLVSFAGVCGVRVSEVSTGLQLLFILPSLPPFDPGSLGSRLIGLTIGMVVLIITDRVLLPDPGPPSFASQLAQAAEKARGLAAGIVDACRVAGSITSDELDRLAAEAKTAATGIRLDEIPLAERPSAPTRLQRGLTDATGALRAACYRLLVLRAEVRDDPDDLPVPVVAAVESTLADARTALLGRSPAPSTDALAAALESERELWRAVLAEHSGTADPGQVRPLRGAATLVAAIQAADSARALVLALRAGFGASVPADQSGPNEPFWYAHRSSFALIWHRVRQNLTVRSVELQNALRLAAGLAVARFVAGEFGLSHGLWVLLATLTLTRTSVRATRGALKPALIGTVIGVVLAGLLLLLAGSTAAAYVVVMPIALFAAVLAGPTVGPIGTQAAFTLVVACLFSQVAPPTLELARDRLVDVLVGAAVGVAVGVLAWPRGGQAELRRAGSRCLSAAADCVDTTADWIVATCPPDALDARLHEVRVALAFYDGTYAQYRSEPVDARDSTDWLIVGVVTARAANGAAAAARWAEQRGALPWEDVRADLETAARRIADEFRSAAHRVATPSQTVSISSRATLREADRAAIRSGLAETAREPGRHERPNATLRAVEAWGWLWWLADDLSRLEGETAPMAAPASTTTT
jgi:Fusaric acid resistance protein-like